MELILFSIIEAINYGDMFKLESVPIIRCETSVPEFKIASFKFKQFNG